MRAWFYWRRQRHWVPGFVARCVHCRHCRATTVQGRIARPLAATLRATAPGQIRMLDFVHVAGLDKKAQQPDPAVNAVKAKTKAKVTASKAKTEVNKAKVKKASAARNSKQLMSLGCLLGVLGGLGRALLDVSMRYHQSSKPSRNEQSNT